jgi:hypothetical protein
MSIEAAFKKPLFARARVREQIARVEGAELDARNAGLKLRAAHKQLAAARIRLLELSSAFTRAYREEFSDLLGTETKTQ